MSDHKIVMPLEEIMGDRFGRYSKYIIQDRALPDVRDGLKPVQRRILYAMMKDGNTHAKPYRKSAKTVGNVIGNYHPHGDTSVYEAMVRMSQEWKMRAPLIDMQGNNGSIDNDPPAAMRYTEARLSKIALELLQDIDKETVNMSLNFDDTEYEPTVLPARFPNILINGATGISAGYATDIPPHNLEEVIDATIYRIRHPKCKFEDLMQFVKGPDFPTGAIVEGKKEIYQALKTGKGKVIVRSKVNLVEEKNINMIVVDEIPYEVNKSDMVRRIDEIRFNRQIDGIIEVRDESDRNGMRIVIEVKKEANLQNVLNYLYKNTDLQRNYNYNMVAIKDKRPCLMGLEEILDAYIEHQIDFTTRRCQYDLKKAQARCHIVDGLIKAVSILDEVVHTIRHSKDKADAKNNLVAKYGFSLEQAEAIVMLQLYRLTNTDIVSLEKEEAELTATITKLSELLVDEKKMKQAIIAQLQEIKKKYPFPRLTQIKDEVENTDIDKSSMVIPEDVYITITRDGYIKRISMRSYKAGSSSAPGKKDDDELLYCFKANTTNTLLVFTNMGNYLYLPVHELEEFRWRELGKHISYFLKISNEEKIIGAMLVEAFHPYQYVVLVTKKGQIKRTTLSDFQVTRYSRPLKCINLKENDELAGITLTNPSDAVLLITKNGYGSLFSQDNIQLYGIKAAGVKGINAVNDEVVSLLSFLPEQNASVALFARNGKVKRMLLDKIPLCTKGNKGIMMFKQLRKNKIELAGAIIVESKETKANLITQEYTNMEYAPFACSVKDLEGGFTQIPDCTSIIDVRSKEIIIVHPMEEVNVHFYEENTASPKFVKQQFNFDE